MDTLKKKRSSLGRLLMLACCISFVVPCNASNWQGLISRLYIRSTDGLIYISVEASEISGVRPACASANDWYMISDENSMAGRQQYAALLAAKISRTVVQITGTETCDRWAGGEDIREVRIVD